MVDDVTVSPRKVMRFQYTGYCLSKLLAPALAYINDTLTFTRWSTPPEKFIREQSLATRGCLAQRCFDSLSLGPKKQRASPLPLPAIYSDQLACVRSTAPCRVVGRPSKQRRRKQPDTRMYVKYLAVLTYSEHSMVAPGLALSLRKVTLRQGKVLLCVLGASRA